MAIIDAFVPRIEPWRELQRKLHAFNAGRLLPTLPRAPSLAQPLTRGADDDASAAERQEREHRDLELRFVETERVAVRAQAAEAPLDPDSFVAWFEGLEKNGPGQHDRLFDWLEHQAPLEAMTWFLRQEVAGEAGFDDLVALTQVKMPSRVKLELARNYWDEMGQGHAGGMHGPMLGRLATELGIGGPSSDDVVSEALAVGNLLVALAVHRQYAYASIGALGAIELTAPGRAAKVSAGLKRLGVSAEARRYFALHATLDVKHSAAWNREVIRPLIEADSRVAHPMAEGALMRLAAGARCFERYRYELAVGP